MSGASDAVRHGTIAADAPVGDSVHIKQGLGALSLGLACGAAGGQTAPLPDGAVYTCKDDQGRTLTRDRYIAECSHKEQRVLNRDGSLRAVIAPTLTADEAARREAEARTKRDEEQRRRDAIRYDELLLKRYPDAVALDRDRGAALSDWRLAIQRAETRLAELQAERRPLLDEAEFFRGRRMPSALKQRLDDNAAATVAQRDVVQRAQAEAQRINDKFDRLLERMRQLWSGAKPGTLGPPEP